MLDQVDKYLAAGVVAINFFIMGILESSLYTILPKYLSNDSRSALNSTSNSTQTTSLENCYLTSPPYVIVSLIFLSKSVAQLFFNPIIGCMLDKINAFFILFLAHGLGIVVFIIYAFNNSVLLYVLGRILDAFLNCAIFIAVFSIISKIFVNVNIRGRYFGLANIFYFISHSVGPVYAAEIDKIFGKTTLFLSLIPLWFICGVLTYLQYWKNKRNKKVSEKKAMQLVELSLERDETFHNSPSPDDEGTDEVAADVPALNSFQEDPNVKINLKKSSKWSKRLESLVVFQMLKDKFVIACLFQLFIVNLSMFSLPPTLPSWMAYKLCSNEVQQGLVWSFGFLGYLCGVSMIVLILLYIPKVRLFATVFAQIVLGILLVALPFSRDWKLIFIPIIGMYFIVGVVEQVIFPLTTLLADSRFNSNYGIMSSLTAQSLTLCGVIGTLFCGYIADKFGFHTLSILLGIINLLFSPVALIHRNISK